MVWDFFSESENSLLWKMKKKFGFTFYLWILSGNESSIYSQEEEKINWKNNHTVLCLEVLEIFILLKFCKTFLSVNILAHEHEILTPIIMCAIKWYKYITIYNLRILSHGFLLNN